ncbi:glycosyltransferase [Canibacter zhoujuaniae]|uniref:glycosyltransferase n=1 Tax=Canibacter zhoujuaniae TaxID=2708343 RepID=UPI001422138F|nr:glycosyltransferase [Canibacter zhoujuaniae]
MDIVIASRIYRPEPGAAPIYLGAVVDEATSRGHSVRVLTVNLPKRRKRLPTLEKIKSFPVLRDREGYVRGYIQYMSFDIPLACRLLFSKKPDVVFVEPPPTTGAVARVICKMRGIPYVYRAADLWSEAAAHATKSQTVLSILRRIEKFALNGAKALTTVSSNARNRILELAPAAEVIVAGTGADTDSFHYSQAPISPYFIYAGTFTELHGAQILIPAFAKLLRQKPEFRLIFVGNSTVKDEIMAAARELNIADRVEILDPRPVSELLPLLQSATASLATLDPQGGYEFAFTTKIYSSLAAGCPVIFSGVGPTKDFLDENPELFSLHTNYAVDEIYEAMLQFANAPLHDSSRRAVADWTAENFSLKAAGRTVVNVLEKAAAS